MRWCAHRCHGLQYYVDQIEITLKSLSKFSAQRILNIFGTLLVIISLGYIATLLFAQRDTVLTWRPDAKAISVLLLSIIGYAASGILLARAWRELLLWSGEDDINTGDAYCAYGRSQIAKYIPGNIAQLVGRHVIGRQLGWSHTGLVIAGALELVSLLFVTSVIAAIGLSLTVVVIDVLSLPLLAALACSLIVGTVLALRVGPHIVERRWPEIATRLHHCSTTGLWRTGLLHLGFFMVSGLIFMLIGLVVLDTFFPPSLWPGVFGLVAFAWVVGIITPGAPSGIGIREGVLALGLANVTSTSEMLLLVVLFRLVTVSGDIVFFLFTTLLSNKEISFE